MKTVHLPETDLARIAPLAPAERQIALEAIKLGHPPYNLHPSRHRVLDIFNVEVGMFRGSKRPSLSLVENLIRKECTSAEQTSANLAVARALYNFAERHDIRGLQHEFLALPVGLTEKVTYWSSAVISIDGVPTIPFIDPRLSKKLTRIGRQFVFSAMHERFRVDEDLRGVRFAVIQFKGFDDGSRLARMFTNEKIEVIPYEAMKNMVAETYAAWHEILNRREDDVRKSGSGTTGPLGF